MEGPEPGGIDDLNAEENAGKKIRMALHQRKRVQ